MVTLIKRQVYRELVKQVAFKAEVECIVVVYGFSETNIYDLLLLLLLLFICLHKYNTLQLQHDQYFPGCL